MFKNYSKNTFEKLRKQHNILVLVGNGFDLALLRKYNVGKMKGKTTSYTDFYEYIKYYNLSNENNLLYKKMTEDREKGKENWSDFEATIDEMVKSSPQNIELIENCIDEFQAYFTRFLNELVNSDVLLEISKDVMNKRLALQSLSCFMKDLEDRYDINFSSDADHYDLYYYVFFNFNYTSLLDNYLYLDKEQFDPHKWKYVDRNFEFYPNKTGTNWSSYLVSDVIHPHGFQDIPRSILFGIDLPQYDRGRGKEKRLIKSYWAQYDVKYKSYFDNVELFIIYGMAISQTDGWWFDQIFDSILKNNSELIIYKYGTETEQNIQNTFINACIRHMHSSKEDIARVKQHIRVVTFEKNDTYFLGIEKKD